MPEHRVTALANFEKPRTKKQLRSFLGSVSYYRRFIHNFADLSSTLTPATSLKVPLQVDWTEEMIKSFCELKMTLCRSCVLFIPVSSDVFVLYTDALDAGVGGCLHVVRGSDEFPVGFFSRQLRPAEKNYSVIGIGVSGDCVESEIFRVLRVQQRGDSHHRPQALPDEWELPQ